MATCFSNVVSPNGFSGGAKVLLERHTIRTTFVRIAQTDTLELLGQKAHSIIQILQCLSGHLQALLPVAFARDGVVVAVVVKKFVALLDWPDRSDCRVRPGQLRVVVRRSSITESNFHPPTQQRNQ
jgi:hypothetical protein